MPRLPLAPCPPTAGILAAGDRSGQVHFLRLEDRATGLGKLMSCLTLMRSYSSSSFQTVLRFFFGKQAADKFAVF